MTRNWWNFSDVLATCSSGGTIEGTLRYRRLLENLQIVRNLLACCLGGVSQNE